MVACLAGIVYCGVRWKMVRCPAWSAITGIACTPLEPVPMTATRFPLKSTFSWGQLPVWYRSPSKESSPFMSGTLPVEMHPTPVIRNRAVTQSP